MKPVISPEVINILCEDPEPSVQQQINSIPQPEPEPEFEPEFESEPQPEPQPKKSFWSKVCNFCKKAYEVVKPVLNFINTIAGIINAVARYKNAYGGNRQYAW